MIVSIVILFVFVILLAVAHRINFKKLRIANLRIDGLKEYLYEEVETNALAKIKMSEGLDILRDNVIDGQTATDELRNQLTALVEQVRVAHRLHGNNMDNTQALLSRQAEEIETLKKGMNNKADINYVLSAVDHGGGAQ